MFLKPSNLKCEYCSEPIGIDNPFPRFEWILEDSERGKATNAYRLIVASCKKNLENGIYDMWDSGMVLNERSNSCIYEGQHLIERNGYAWRVMVWDKSGMSGAWSEMAYFETGFFNVDRWKTGWITATNSLKHVRKEIFIDTCKTVLKARMYIASTSGATGIIGNRMNLYELRMNGTKIGNDIMNPGQLICKNDKALYRTYDVTKCLQPGENAVGIIFLSGRLSLRLLIVYSDGTVCEDQTDGTWKQDGQGPYLSLWYKSSEHAGGQGEVYDARNELTGWDYAGYDDTCWSQAKVTEAPERLFAQLQSIHIFDILKPKTIVSPFPGLHIVDFGHNIHGHVQISVKGISGTSVTL